MNVSAADTSSIIREELLAPGRTIYGYVTAPVNYRDTKLPTIIFSHGFSGRAESGDAWAHQLAAHGYVVYSFDFMGATEQSRSGNDVLAMSPFTEKDDLDAVLTMIRGQQFVDTQNIFLMPVWPAATTSSTPGGPNAFLPSSARDILLFCFLICRRL